MPIVPFAPFEPDRSRFNPQVATVVLNAKPVRDGWGPMNSLVSVSDALPSAPRGGIAVKADDGTWKIFAGTATNLYRINASTYLWEEISRVTDDYLLPDGVFWSFARWGNWLIATAEGSDFPQYVDLAGSADFANLTNATFEAEIVAVVGDFLVFARIDGDKRKMKWSGVNDANFYTKAQRGSDEQILPTGGAIQSILPQQLNAIIVQEAAIRTMLFDPESGLAFRFEPIDLDRGTFAQRSVVNIGPNDFVYLAKDGFYRGLEARPIGAERVNRWFFDQVAGDKIDLVSGYADQFEKQILWRYEDESGDSHILGYDWQLDRWFPADIEALDIFGAATAGITLDGATTLYSTLGGMPYALGSRFYLGGIPNLGGFTSDFKFGFFDGPTLEAIIETEDKALNFPRRAITSRATVLVDASDSELQVGTKATQDAALSYGSYLTQISSQPFFNTRTSGRWHRFRVKRPASSTWKNASGIDVAFTDGGSR